MSATAAAAAAVAAASTTATPAVLYYKENRRYIFLQRDQFLYYIYFYSILRSKNSFSWKN